LHSLRAFGTLWRMRNPTFASSRFRSPASSLALIAGCFLPELAFAATAARTDYSQAIVSLESAIADELTQDSISGVSVALVDDQRIVYARGFGFADKSRRIPSSADTVYRAGSISKLFTALAAMQLAEQGRLNIDQPVTNYDPGFRIVVPFDDAKPITLRQLMCHRSGLIREVPVGSYFDSSEPGAEKTVASLASCVLVYPPGTKTKYSNSGVTVVGHIVEKVARIPFEAYQQKHILEPLGMNHSGWRLDAQLRFKLATGYLPVADGKGGFDEIRAPQFEFGILPAGNLYTTCEDLGRFLMCLFAEGRIGGRAVIKPETLAQMFTPQLAKTTNGFGLGFSVGNFRQHKTVSHMGAVYGFTSALTAIPHHKVGVVVLCNDDIVVGPVRKLNNTALGLMLEAKIGETMPAPASPLKLPAAELNAFTGDYESESFWAKIEMSGSALQANISNQRMVLTATEPLRFEGHGRLAHQSPFVFQKDAAGRAESFTALGQSFRRVDSKATQEIPGAWRKYLGSYGPSFIPLIISARHGHLYAMTENEFDYRLTPLTPTVFKMPPGLYLDEQLVFQLDAMSRVHSAVLANMPLRRRGSR